MVKTDVVWGGIIGDDPGELMRSQA